MNKNIIDQCKWNDWNGIVTPGNKNPTIYSQSTKTIKSGIITIIFTVRPVVDPCENSIIEFVLVWGGPGYSRIGGKNEEVRIPESDLEKAKLIAEKHIVESLVNLTEKAIFSSTDKMTPTKNIYIRTVSLNNRKSCPTCSQKLDGRLIYSAGEYVNAKWNTIQHFCELCFSTNLKKDCDVFKAKLVRDIAFVPYQGTKIPDWLRL